MASRSREMSTAFSPSAPTRTGSSIFWSPKQSTAFSGILALPTDRLEPSIILEFAAKSMGARGLAKFRTSQSLRSHPKWVREVENPSNWALQQDSSVTICCRYGIPVLLAGAANHRGCGRFRCCGRSHTLLWPVSDRATLLWPVSDRATPPTEGLRRMGETFGPMFRRGRETRAER